MKLKKILRSLCGGWLLALILMAAVTLSARAESDAVKSYPNRVIRMIVGFGPGGGNDIFARLVGQEPGYPWPVGDRREQAGCRWAPRRRICAGQPADGYTLLVGATGAMSIAAAIYPDLRYGPTKSFVPLAMIAHFPLFLVVPENGPVKSVKELVAWAKAHPNKANYATTHFTDVHHNV